MLVYEKAIWSIGLPFVVSTLASAYLMAANLSAYGYVGLSAGAAHLLEVFGDARLHAEYMAPIYEGRWTGTMALTEPGAGSSLADVATLEQLVRGKLVELDTTLKLSQAGQTERWRSILDNDVGLRIGREIAVWSWPKYREYFEGTATVR